MTQTRAPVPFAVLEPPPIGTAGRRLNRQVCPIRSTVRLPVSCSRCKRLEVGVDRTTNAAPMRPAGFYRISCDFTPALKDRRGPPCSLTAGRQHRPALPHTMRVVLKRGCARALGRHRRCRRVGCHPTAKHLNRHAMKKSPSQPMEPGRRAELRPAAGPAPFRVVRCNRRMPVGQRGGNESVTRTLPGPDGLRPWP
jgi:hypothetical protein